MVSKRRWWAHIKIAGPGPRWVDVGPYETRERAAEAGWQDAIGGEISTGYGLAGAWFDIRWHKRGKCEMAKVRG